MNKQIKTLGFTFTLCIAVALATNTSQAQEGRMHHEDHPAYFHALSDLRAARWMLEHRPGNWMQAEDERAAEKEINDAIHDIKEAAIDDGKNIDDHPQLEERGDHVGRLREAQDFLRKAKEDLAHEEDNGFARGLRNRSFKHIDFAQDAINRAIVVASRERPMPSATVKYDAPRPMPPAPPPPALRPMPMQHPAYMHALEDLRAARWMLEHRPGNWAQGAEEHEAVKQIEAALREIKEAAIDDGKNLDDHPHVDETPDHRGRLNAAIDFLKKAREDIAHGEDDAFANKLRERSFRHIDEAMRNVEIAKHIFH